MINFNTFIELFQGKYWTASNSIQKLFITSCKIFAKLLDVVPQKNIPITALSTSAVDIFGAIRRERMCQENFVCGVNDNHDSKDKLFGNTKRGEP